MNIEEARERIKELELIYEMQYSILEDDNHIKNKEALELVLNELDKKDKIIDMMAEHIAEDNSAIEYESCGCIGIGDKMWLNDELIKEYFYNKAKEKY